MLLVFKLSDSHSPSLSLERRRARSISSSSDPSNLHWYRTEMESMQSRVESWIRDQRAKILKVTWGPLQWWMRWPWNNDGRKQRKMLQEEYERRKKQLNDLCLALKAESVSELQDVLCCMVLSECVYKVWHFWDTFNCLHCLFGLS